MCYFKSNWKPFGIPKRLERLNNVPSFVFETPFTVYAKSHKEKQDFSTVYLVIMARKELHVILPACWRTIYIKIYLYARLNMHIPRSIIS